MKKKITKVDTKARSDREKRYQALIEEFQRAGFTYDQTVFLVDLLDSYFPLV